MKKKLFFVLGAMVLSLTAFGQESATATVVSQGEFIGKTIPLRDMPTIDELENFNNDDAKEIKHYIKRGNEPVNESTALPLNGDPVRQANQGTREQLNILQNFDGASVAEGQAIPPDPTGAVGPNHYVHSVNVVVKIFDKVGNLLAGPTFLGTFLGNGSSNGDPIVMYDHLADRFFVSQFQISNNALIIGISDTPDPTGSYNVYSFPLDAFPDYPHYSVWHDGYYMTANKFQGNTIYVLDRASMIAGLPNPTIIGFNLPQVVNNPAAVFSPEPANLIGDTFDPTSPAYIVYLQDDAWVGVSEDHLKVWEIDVNFATPGASTISNPIEITTAPFDSFLRPFGTGDVEQPGTSQRIDAISGVISYAANYRAFPTYNSWVITFNADVGGITPGVRWIELRNDATNDWTIFQEGTYAPADGESRFMGSAAMDEDGNIGLGFNIGSENTFAGIRYTGRLDGDDLGEMTFPESTIVNGNGRQTNTNRFGDYTHLSMDPDGVTFWFTAQYMAANNFWRTRIASFRISPSLANDVGFFNFVSPQDGALGNAETVEAKIYNFGTDPQSNFDVELYLDGNLVATETFTGTIQPQEEVNYIFNQTLDLSAPGTTYSIEARTDLAGDANAPNDGFTIEVDNTTLSVGDAEFNSGEFTIVPASQKVYDITFTTNKNYGDISYEIYNTIGQKLYTGVMDAQGNEHTARVDMNTSPIGVYFVKLTNGDLKASKRFIVR
ncbi:CARDB domain-containing protein [Marinirhabdus gelatinilytica]|uniref:Putative secreted protein (Por secretion system target) n=1 Tax=Marinirhabdus gelatinilytica TaxID=1703343 RepID=A0A370QEV0_9FLAO|nr:CARDB domain-containing protein [Marinirhabdus gelatinilytica]RDK86895.1 putative secreted protein (Por secretion system target) [Marinirhabdus gelatinilytica]